MHDSHYERVHRQLSACKFELVDVSDREGTALLNSRLQSSSSWSYVSTPNTNCEDCSSGLMSAAFTL